MRFCRFNAGRIGVIVDDYVYDVTARTERFAAPVRGDALITNLATLRAELERVDLGAPACAVGDASFLAPVATPTKIIGAPVNYQAHIEEAVADVGITFNHAVAQIGKAGLFLKSTTSLVGPSEGVAIRFPDRRTDHELELGLVIGTLASNVSEASALDYVAGYAIALDMTVRGTEDRSFRKSVDTYSVLGPWLVGADEIPDPDKLELTLRVNGEVRQASNTSRLIFNVRKLIAWASEWYTLYPGDIIMTGTPEGVAPIADGDVMECEIERLGSMRVKVRAAQTASLTGARA